jgi:hypothetical protein
MKLLLYSGLLYLTGVAIVLLLQPSLMFTEDGQWKEFGIGRSPKTHTWMPFWLFSVVWALLSYIIILIFAGRGALPGVNAQSESHEQTPNLSYRNFEVPQGATTATPVRRGRRQAAAATTAPIPGYYILNRETTEATGIPKYIYLGPEPPGVEETQL